MYSSNQIYRIHITDHNIETKQPHEYHFADDCYQAMVHYFHQIDKNLPNGSNVTFEPKLLKITIKKPNNEKIIIQGIAFQDSTFR